MQMRVMTPGSSHENRPARPRSPNRTVRLGLLSALLNIASVSALAEPEAELRFLRTSSTGAATASEFASGGRLQARDEAEFVTVSWVFERPVRLTRVELESCGPAFGDSAEFLVGPPTDPESLRLTSEGGRVIHGIDLPSAKVDKKASVLSVNFGHARPLCLKEARFFDGKKKLKPVYPEGVPGTVSAGGAAGSKVTAKSPDPALTPSTDWRVDHPLNLFDSRPETAWTTAPFADTLVVEFERAVTFDRLRVWNGDERSRRDFRESSRVQKLMMKGDDGYAEALTLSDTTGGQELPLKKAFKGKKLSIKVESVYAGASKIPAAISELRFVNSSETFYIAGPSRVSRQREIEEKNLEAFGKAGGVSILDHDLVSADDEDAWTFRLRADGTFFVKGFGDEARKARVFQGHGTYRVESAGKDKITLVFGGLKATGPLPLDLNPCHLACSAETLGPGPSGAADSEVIDEIVEISKTKTGFIVRNRTKRGDRTLPFSDLRVRLSSLQE